eukprot:snap_masked-scaffold_18-processed-gene-0.13-mRNA-1 protein AED:1.00 eAED:1.00 QI:0/0/0/0/1/1/3/0/253
MKHQVTIPYEHEQNGRAENSNRILLENMRSLVKQAGVSRVFWSFAMKCATHAYNFTKLSKEDTSPWELLFGVQPPVEKLRIFGVVGFANIYRENRRKLDDTATRVMFLGYGENFDGYVIREANSGRIFVTRIRCLVQRGRIKKLSMIFFAPKTTFDGNETFDDELSEAPAVTSSEQDTTVLHDTSAESEYDDVVSESLSEDDEVVEINEEPVSSRLRSSVKVPERFKDTLSSFRPGTQSETSQELLTMPVVIA